MARRGLLKLTPAEALDIHLRARSGLFFQREVAQAFGVSQSAVSLILHCKRWGWLFETEKENLMTDKPEGEMTESELQAKISRLQSTLAKRRARHTPQWQTEMANAVPTDVVRDVTHDPGLRRVSEPSSVLAQTSGRVEIKRGTGWVEPNALGAVPGLGLMDKMLDAQDAQDRADLARRLSRSKE
jgi:predicted transcriptional regulator